MDETEKIIIDEKLREIESWHPEERKAEIVYFEPDATKKGGHYLSKAGCIKKIDIYTREVVFADGTKIFIEEIYNVKFC